MIDERSGAERFNSRRGSDSRVSIQFLSLLSGVAALWFFVSPWSYYGVSLHESAWNDWIVGAVIQSRSAPVHAAYPGSCLQLGKFGAGGMDLALALDLRLFGKRRKVGE